MLHFPILSTLPKSQQNFKIVTKGSCKKARAKLADLMIEHDVGVSKVGSYEVKKIDLDFFTES
jgi:hypothetical protein